MCSLQRQDRTTTGQKSIGGALNPEKLLFRVEELKIFISETFGRLKTSLHCLTERLLQNSKEERDARREDVTAGRRSCHPAFKSLLPNSFTHPTCQTGEPLRSTTSTENQELNKKPSLSNIGHKLRSFHLVRCHRRGSYPQFSLSEHCAAFRLNEVE